MSLIEQLRLSANLKGYWDRRQRTLLDSSGNANHAIVAAGSLEFQMTRKGPGIAPLDATGRLTAGTSATLDLTTAGTLLLVWQQNTAIGGASKVIFYKGAGTATLLNGYHFYLANSPTVALGDGAAFQTVASTRTSDSLIGLPTVGVFTWDATICRWAINGVQEAPVARTRTPSPAGQTVSFGPNGVGANTILVGVVNRYLDPAEAAQFYTDFLREGFVGQLARRNFVYVYPNLKAAEYVAKGIVLDTDFVSEYPAGVRRIRDLTGNYPGTITGTPVPGPNGEGQVYAAATDRTNFGNITQINNAQTFTIDGWIEPAAGNIPNGSYWLYCEKDGTHVIDVYTTGGASANPTMNLLVYNGGATLGTCAAAIRSGVRQHLCWVFNGAGLTNADRLKFFTDGEERTLSFTGIIPATLPDLSGFGMYNPFQCSWKMTKTRMRIPALTAAQVRQEYLTTGGRNLDLRVTLEDTFPTFVNVTAPGQIGPWTVISGSFKVSETVDGKRWIECVTIGAIGMPLNHFTGTWHGIFRRANPVVGNFVWMFISNLNLIYTAAGVQGYGWYADGANGNVACFRMPGPAWEQLSVAGQIVAATDYRLCTNRRPSDGRFTTYIKGGAFAQWQLINSGAAGSNPGPADATYMTSQYTTIAMFPGDKILGYDPNDKSVGLFHWPGQLDPTAGELKIR